MGDQEDQGPSQADIDATLAAAQGGGEEGPSGGVGGISPSQDEVNDTATKAQPEPVDVNGQETSSASEDPSAELTQADVDAALAGASHAADPSTRETEKQSAQPEAPPADDGVNSTGKTFDEIAAAMAADIEEKVQQGPEPAAPPRGEESAATSPPELAEAEPFQLDSLDETQTEAQTMVQGIGLLNDVELQVKIELGRAAKTVEEVLALGSGSVVELDRLAGDPVDILVNDRLVARGEVLVLNDNLCIRVNEIVSRDSGAEVA